MSDENEGQGSRSEWGIEEEQQETTPLDGSIKAKGLHTCLPYSNRGYVGQAARHGHILSHAAWEVGHAAHPLIEACMPKLYLPLSHVCSIHHHKQIRRGAHFTAGNKKINELSLKLNLWRGGEVLAVAMDHCNFV